MNVEPKMSEAQWTLILELLEQEQRDLPAEIHHTRTATVKRELQQRLELVRRTVDQLRGVTAEA